MLDFIHIGYHKTGSTFLQKQWLPNQPKILMLDEILGNQYHKFNSDFIWSHDLDFESSTFRQRIEDSFTSNNKFNKNKKIVGWSDESLSGDAFSGRDSKKLAERILSTFGKTKIIICIRSQQSIVNSLYYHYIKKGGSYSPRKFIYSKHSIGKGLFHKLQYDKLIEYYFKVFGRENTFVYLYEYFKGDSYSCLKKISQFIDFIPGQYNDKKILNVSMSKYAVSLIRILNRIGENPIDSGVPYHRFMSKTTLKSIFRFIYSLDLKFQYSSLNNKCYFDDETLMYINKQFNNSNRRLQKLLNQDLSEYGYI
tara:strand:- start:1681 stop:2607 length:927 start_codon:yes stop_codon:yes gene_type:complete